MLVERKAKTEGKREPAEAVLVGSPMFRFTIRDVLWLTVVVGLACGWGIEHREAKQARRLRAENARLAAENDDLTFDAFMIASWIDPQAGSLPKDEKERLWKKYEKESRLIPRYNK